MDGQKVGLHQNYMDRKTSNKTEAFIDEERHSGIGLGLCRL